MFDKFGSFKSHSISEIRNLVGLYYVFCWQSDTSTYIMDLLYKNQYFYDDSENVGDLGHG